MAKNDVSVELYYSGTWNDITATNDVYTRDPIEITRGRPDQVSRIPPSTLSLSIENRDGKYSPRNPTSPLYGLIGRNTPIRVGIGKSTVLSDAFTRSVTDGWGTSTSGHVYTLQGTAGDFDVNGTQGTIQPSTTGTDRFAHVDSGWTDANIIGDFSLNTLPASGIVYFGLTARYTDANNHYVGMVQVATTGAVTLRLRSRIAGVTTDVTQATGLTLSTGVKHRIRFECYGSFLRVKVWLATGTEPTSGAAVLSTLLPGLVAGTRIGVFVRNDTAVTTHVISVDDVAAEPQFRFHGEVESWPQRWNVKGNDVWAPVTANGIMHRLNVPGTKATAISALRRALAASVALGLVAYYPLEEGKDAAAPLPYGTLGSPGLVNYRPAYQPGQQGPTGTRSLYGITPLGGAGTSFIRNGVGVALGVPDHAATGVEIITMHIRWKPFENAKVLDGADFAEINHRLEFIGGGVFGAQVNIQSSTSSSTTVAVFPYDSTYTGLGSVGNVSSTVNMADGNWHEIQIRFVQNGAAIDVALFVDGTNVDTDTISATTMGNTKRVVLGAEGSYDSGLVVGLLFEGVYEASHVSVHTNAAVGQFYQPMIGHTGEKGATRISRLCAENGITLAVIGDPNMSAAVGVQRVAPTLELLHDAADADGGILYEPRHSLGLAYRTHASLYNQTPTVALNYAAGGEVAPPLAPVEDTDAIANDITVTRFEGGSARAVQETGTLNVQESPDGVGRIPKDYTLVLADDAQTVQQAAWRRHVGTWDEARYPVVSLDLTAMAAEGKTLLIAQSASLDVGDRLTIANPPAWLPPDKIEQHARGFTETIESHRWSIVANTTPALPYSVGAYDTARYDNGACTLNEALDTTETAVDVISVVTPWGSQFPYDVNIGGERMTVTARSGAGLTQTLTVTRSVNGVMKTHTAGAPVRLFTPARYAL